MFFLKSEVTTAKSPEKGLKFRLDKRILMKLSICLSNDFDRFDLSGGFGKFRNPKLNDHEKTPGPAVPGCRDVIV